MKAGRAGGSGDLISPSCNGRELLYEEAAHVDNHILPGTGSLRLQFIQFEQQCGFKRFGNNDYQTVYMGWMGYPIKRNNRSPRAIAYGVA